MIRKPKVKPMGRPLSPPYGQDWRIPGRFGGRRVPFAPTPFSTVLQGFGVYVPPNRTAV